MSNRDIHIDFVDLNWNLLHACAWSGYQLHGRGALFVDISLMIELNLVPLAPVPYIPTQDTVWPLPEMNRMVAGYCPEKEIVILFFCPIEGYSCYRVSNSFSNQIEQILTRSALH